MAFDPAQDVISALTPQPMVDQSQIQKVVQPTLPPDANQGTTPAAPAQAAPTGKGGSSDEVVDPWKLTPQLQTDVGSAIDRAHAADATIQAVAAGFPAIDQQRQAATAKAVTDSNAVLDQVTAATNNFQTRVQPLFQQRAALAARNVEIDNMNPLQRWAVNEFSFNGNQARLKERMSNIDGELATLGQGYQTLMGLNDAQLKVIQERKNNATAMGDVQQADSETAARYAMQGVGSINQVVGSEVQGLQANQEVLKAQELARQDVIGGLTLSDASKGLQQAQQSPQGVAYINGVPIRAAELQARVNNWTEQNLSIQGRQLAVATGNLAYKNAMEERIAQHMSGPQLQAAIAAGGKLPDGTVINQRALTEAYASSLQRNQLIAEDYANQNSTPVFGAQVQALGANADRMVKRSQDLFGSVPTEIQQNNTAVAAKIQAMGAQIRQATQAGAGAETVAKLLPEIQQLYKGQSDLADKYALKAAGGDKDIATLYKSLMDGDPMNGETAAKGMIGMARKNVQIRMSGLDAETYKEVQAYVQKYDAQQQAGSPTSVFGKAVAKEGAKGQADPALIEGVSNIINKHYVNNGMNQAAAQAPGIAAQIKGPDGNPHPASQINPNDLVAALRNGDAQGYQWVEHNLGLTPGQGQLLFQQGPGYQGKDSIWNGPDGKTGVSGRGIKGKSAADSVAAGDFGGLTRAMISHQNTSFLQNLDQSPSARNGFKPSAAIVDLYNNPQFQNIVTNGTLGQQQSTVGGSITSSVAHNSFANRFQQYGEGLAEANRATLQATMNRNLSTSMRIRNYDPLTSTSLALHSVPEFGNQDVAKLLPAVVAQANAKSSGNVNGTTADDLDSVILHGKFEDPALERLRRTAAKSWPQLRPQIDKGWQGYLGSLLDPREDFSHPNYDTQSVLSQTAQ